MRQRSSSPGSSLRKRPPVRTRRLIGLRAVATCKLLSVRAGRLQGCKCSTAACVWRKQSPVKPQQSAIGNVIARGLALSACQSDDRGRRPLRLAHDSANKHMHGADPARQRQLAGPPERGLLIRAVPAPLMHPRKAQITTLAASRLDVLTGLHLARCLAGVRGQKAAPYIKHCCISNHMPLLDGTHNLAGGVPVRPPAVGGVTDQNTDHRGAELFSSNPSCVRPDSLYVRLLHVIGASAARRSAHLPAWRATASCWRSTAKSNTFRGRAPATNEAAQSNGWSRATQARQPDRRSKNPSSSMHGVYELVDVQGRKHVPVLTDLGQQTLRGSVQAQRWAGQPRCPPFWSSLDC